MNVAENGPILIQRETLFVHSSVDLTPELFIGLNGHIERVPLNEMIVQCDKRCCLVKGADRSD